MLEVLTFIPVGSFTLLVISIKSDTIQCFRSCLHDTRQQSVLLDSVSEVIFQLSFVVELKVKDLNRRLVSLKTFQMTLFKQNLQIHLDLMVSMMVSMFQLIR